MNEFGSAYKSVGLTGGDFLLSLDEDQTVSRAQVLQYVENQFALADKNQDGELDIEELPRFLYAIAHAGHEHF